MWIFIRSMRKWFKKEKINRWGYYIKVEGFFEINRECIKGDCNNEINNIRKKNKW